MPDLETADKMLKLDIRAFMGTDPQIGDERQVEFLKHVLNQTTILSNYHHDRSRAIIKKWSRNTMVVHKTIVHGKCPINGLWDYYELEVRTSGFVRCEDIEIACNRIRGSEMTQEQMAEELRESREIPSDCVILLRGRHGQNVETLVEA